MTIVWYYETIKFTLDTILSVYTNINTVHGVTVQRRCPSRLCSVRVSTQLYQRHP